MKKQKKQFKLESTILVLLGAPLLVQPDSRNKKFQFSFELNGTQPSDDNHKYSQKDHKPQLF